MEPRQRHGRPKVTSVLDHELLRTVERTPQSFRRMRQSIHANL
jgi:hypothetical protein